MNEGTAATPAQTSRTAPRRVGGFSLWGLLMAHASTEARKRAHLLYTTTQTSQADIAVEVGVWDRTVHRWIKQEGWERPSGGTERPPKIPPRLRGPAQRLFESGACVADLALLLDCDRGYFYSVARKSGWTRPAAQKPGAAGQSDEVAAVEAVLRDPAATRRDVIRALERAIALTGADALGGDARASGRVTALARLTELARTMAAAAPAPEDRDESADLGALIEEVAQRFEAFDAAEDAEKLRLREKGLSDEAIDRRMKGDGRDESMIRST